MNAEFVKKTLEMVLDKSGLSRARVCHFPRLPSDNGPAYLSKALANYIRMNDLDHFRGLIITP